MHLLLIITDYGSFNNFLSELAVELLKRGNKVDLICSEEKVIKFDDRVNYKNLGIITHFVSFPRTYNILKQLKASRTIHDLVNKINPDIIHAHFTTGIFTTIILKKPKQTLIGTFHGLGYPMMKGIKRKIFQYVEALCISRLDKVLVLNNYDYDILNKKYHNISILDSAGLGCDLSRFNRDRYRDRIESIKSELGIKKNDFVIAFTGRFVKFKGFDLVVKAFLELNTISPSSYKLILIGGRDCIHDTGLNSYESQIYEDCDDIIKVGFTSEVEKYLSVSNMFLFPSLKEGMPVCIIEALAMGLPVITADSRGCNDLVESKRNGILLSKIPTVSEIVNVISRLREFPEELHMYRDYALENRDKLSRKIYIEKQIEFYCK